MKCYDNEYCPQRIPLLLIIVLSLLLIWYSLSYTLNLWLLFSRVEEWSRSEWPAERQAWKLCESRSVRLVIGGCSASISLKCDWVANIEFAVEYMKECGAIVVDWNRWHSFCITSSSISECLIFCVALTVFFWCTPSTRSSFSTQLNSIPFSHRHRHLPGCRRTWLLLSVWHRTDSSRSPHARARLIPELFDTCPPLLLYILNSKTVFY